MPTVPSSQLFPEVVDATSLIAKPTQNIFLPIGIEGEMLNTGDADVGTIYTISTASEGHELFGASSPLAAVIDAALDGGAAPVIAGASANNATPNISERQSVWDDLSSDSRVRLRLTDSVSQSDLVALADSCEQAELVNNKQIAIMGMQTGTDLAGYTAAATAIASSRGVLIAPSVYDLNGNLKTGTFAAAIVASVLAANSDLSNDLDLSNLPLLTGIERDANGNPLFRNKVSGGVKVNEFETLLQGGVSPLAPGILPGTVQITHLRTTFTASGAYDALATRLIVDQLFVDVRDYVLSSGFLRRANTESNRNALAAAVTALLEERSSWVQPVPQSNDTVGYGVSVISSVDNRQVTVSYQGKVVRGIQTVLVAPVLTIPV
jgi:hypothetical protein